MTTSKDEDEWAESSQWGIASKNDTCSVCNHSQVAHSIANFCPKYVKGLSCKNSCCRQEEQPEYSGGKRFDEGKPRVDLLPPETMLYLGKVYLMGSKKYGDRNWEKGMKWNKVLGPMLRHTYKYMMGEKYDKESKLLHTAHIAWNALALLTYEIRGIGENDVQPEGSEGRTTSGA